jgi:hypothetical protein
MLIRKGFVTNSSSTSFVAWGLVMHRSYIPKGTEDDLWDLSFDKDKVAFATEDDGDQCALYSYGSRQPISEYGDGIIPLNSAPDPEWLESILKICDEFGIRIDKEPQWFFMRYAS